MNKKANSPTCFTRFALSSMLATLLAALALLLASPPPPAGAAPITGTELWRKPYDAGGWTDSPRALVLAPGGTAVYVAGYVLPSGGAKTDLCVIKYKVGGGRAWVRTYDGKAHGNDEGFAIARDGAGNVYVGGYVDRATGQDFLLVKYTSRGRRLWVRTWDGAAHGNDRIAALALDAKGNVYAAGRSDGSGTNWDAALVKWTPSGKRAWARRYNGTNDFADELRGIAIDKRNGRIYVAGVTSVAPSRKDWLLIRYGVGGKRYWLRTYGADGKLADASSIALSRRGAPLVAGNAGKSASSDAEAVVVRWTPAGVLDWEAVYAGTDDDYFADMAVGYRGTAYAVGRTVNPAGNDDLLACLVLPDGELQYVTPWGLWNRDDRFEAVACSGEDVYAAGVRDNVGFGLDFLVQKFSEYLDLGWEKVTRQNDILRDDIADDIVARTGKNPGVYVTGRGSQSTFAWDWLTIKYQP